MAFMELVPASAAVTYDSAFQHASLSGTRTALTFQLNIAVTAAWSTSPSKMPLPWTQAYSVPDRSTPRRITCWPDAFSSLLPDTCSCGAAPPPPPPPLDVSVTVMAADG